MCQRVAVLWLGNSRTFRRQGVAFRPYVSRGEITQPGSSSGIRLDTNSCAFDVNVFAANGAFTPLTLTQGRQEPGIRHSNLRAESNRESLPKLNQRMTSGSSDTATGRGLPPRNVTSVTRWRRQPYWRLRDAPATSTTQRAARRHLPAPRRETPTTTSSAKQADLFGPAAR